MDERPDEPEGRGVAKLVAGLVVGLFVCLLLWLTTGSLILGLATGVFLGGIVSFRNIRPADPDKQWWSRF